MRSLSRLHTPHTALFVKTTIIAQNHLHTITTITTRCRAVWCGGRVHTAAISGADADDDATAATADIEAKTQRS